MSSAPNNVTKQPILWLCGKSRFLRETLGVVLRETFGAVAVREFFDGEPPFLRLPERAGWLIWFLNGNEEISFTKKIVGQPAQLNVMLVQSDGHVFVRWADGDETQRVDISLEELVAILKTALDNWRTPNYLSNGESNATYWQ